MKVMRTPKAAEIAITNNCNLRCKYCSHFSSASEVSCDLPAEDWLNFFKELNSLAVMNVLLCGGEPFLREDLKDIICAIARNRMRFGILSNGTLLTGEMAEFLAATKRCDYVQVSIDGSVPITHDSMRGEGSFNKAIAGIRHLKQRNVEARVRVTIHRKNVRDLENIARLLLDDIGLSGFGTNSASYMGVCRRNTEQVQLTAEERALAMEALLKLHKIYPGRISASAGPLAEARMWLEMEEARRQGREGAGDTGCLTSCGGVFQRIGVRADGIIVPCIQLSHIELGRINKDSIIEIWQGHPQLAMLRERRMISLSNFEVCRECGYISYCRGGCPALAYTLTNEVNYPSPDICLRRFLREGGRLPEVAIAGE